MPARPPSFSHPRLVRSRRDPAVNGPLTEFRARLSRSVGRESLRRVAIDFHVSVRSRMRVLKHASVVDYPYCTITRSIFSIEEIVTSWRLHTRAACLVELARRGRS